MGRLSSSTTRILAIKSADAWLNVIDQTGFIAGRLDADWRPVVKFSCLTGTAQIAACWFLLHQISGRQQYLQAARKATEYVRRTISMDGGPDVRGGVKGSFPVDGEYSAYRYLNWAAKFFVDACLLELEMNEKPAK